jgi:hypothetical protein
MATVDDGGTVMGVAHGAAVIQAIAGSAADNQRYGAARVTVP